MPDDSMPYKSIIVLDISECTGQFHCPLLAGYGVALEFDGTENP
jgi:hypothetical protein